MAPYEPLAERFWKLVSKSDGCWLWAGTVTKWGYGRFWAGHRRQLAAHRVAWELTNSPLRDDECVLHKCDVRACVNPSHLFIGSKADNMKDRDAKGRQVKGERVNLAKLTDSQVAEIRAAWTGERGQRLAMMRRYNIGSSALWAIIKGRTWRHV
jgi:hypothetical protein